MTRPTKPKPQPRFVYLLNVAHRRVQAAIQAQGSGASAARAGLLMAIPKGGIPMGELGRQLGLGAPALSGLVDRSIRAGLIERHADPTDGRAWLITLTEDGLEGRKLAVENAKHLNAKLVADFSDDELATVARWLTAVGDRFAKT